MTVAPLEFEKPILELERKLEDLKKHLRGQDVDVDPEVRRISARIAQLKEDIYLNLTPWQRVQIARHTNRPFMLDYSSTPSPISANCTATATSATTTRCPAASPRIGGQRVVVIGHKRAATPRRTSCATSAAPTPKATARRCASCGWRRNSACRSSP